MTFDGLEYVVWRVVITVWDEEGGYGIEYGGEDE